MNIQKYRNIIEQEKGKRDQLFSNITRIKHNIRKNKRFSLQIEEAQLIIQNVAQQTQQKIEFKISEMITSALYAIFDDPYEFKINFVCKRGQTEAEFKFIKNDLEVSPMNASGGGVVLVASFALRIILWSMQQPLSRNTIILDEPFHFLSKDLQEKAGELLNLLSKKLNLQFIVVTHETAYIDIADKIFKVENKKGISHVQSIAK